MSFEYLVWLAKELDESGIEYAAKCIGRVMSKRANDGFIIRFAAWCISALQAVSAVEHWKRYGEARLRRRVANPSDEELRRNANVWIDSFVVLKWLIVLALLLASQGGWVAAILMVYLLFFNLFSYFYYHGWGSQYQPPRLSRDEGLARDRRRLISFLLAFMFSIFGFAYLYAIQIPSRLEWPSEPNLLDAVYLSISNSFTLTYNGFQPRDQVSRGILLLQLINVFVFLTVLIGNAIPSVGRSDPE